MSKEALAKVVQRSISDAAFRRQLATDPTGALRGYDLSGDEKSALRSGDAGRLTSFGVEQRMSKAFTLSTDSSNSGMSNVSNVSTSDISAAHGGALSGGFAAAGNAMQSASLTSADGAAANATLTSGNAAEASSAMGNATLTGGDGAMGNAVLTSGDGAMGNAVLTSGDGTIGSSVIPNDATQFSGAFTGNGPHDIEPVFTGSDQALSSVIPSDGASTLSHDLSAGDTDEGFLPSVGYATDSAFTATDAGGGAGTTGEGTEGPEIQP